MSAEKLVTRQLRRMAFWRVVGDIVAIPRRLLAGIVEALENLDTAIFYLELDAARQYEQLTGVDMARASGNEFRYAGLHPEPVFDFEAEDE